MSDLNRVCVSGRIVTDPELRSTKGGTAVTSFRFASNRAWRDQAGELQQDALFLDVDVYGRQAERVVQHKGKGSFLILDGSLRLQQWEDREGQRRQRLVLVADQILFGPANGKGAADPAAAPAAPTPAGVPAPPAPGQPADDDLAF